MSTMTIFANTGRILIILAIAFLLLFITIDLSEILLWTLTMIYLELFVRRKKKKEVGRTKFGNQFGY